MSDKYKNGKIYTIRYKNDDSLIYVGSTVQPLFKRWYQHKACLNNEKNKEYVCMYVYVCMCTPTHKHTHTQTHKRAHVFVHIPLYLL